MRDFLQSAAGELEAGRSVFAVFVAANTKGSPGTPAARMLVHESGELFGTIGGGVMELREIEQARKALGSKQPFTPCLERLRHRKSDEGGSGTGTLTSGLICGGEQTNVKVIFEGAADLSVLKGALARIEAGEAGLLQVDTSGISLQENSEAAVYMSRFGADSENAPWKLRLNLINLRRIAIFGGGHCSLALARLMVGLGYAVSVVEPREGLFTVSAMPDGVRILQQPYEAAGGMIDFSEQTLFVVMTHSMATDVEALSGILKGEFRSVGVMGSPPKIAGICRTLSELGLSNLQIEKIRAPLGLSFNSDTPEEIAVSIAAQILLERESN